MNESFPIGGEGVPSPVPRVAEQPAVPEPESYRRLREDAAYFLGLAAAVGALYAACFVRAGGLGLNAVLYALGWCVFAHLALKKLGLADLRRDGGWYAGIMLLAATVFWTANFFIQFVSLAGCVLLQCFWILNVFADIRDWHFGKAAGAVLRLAGRTMIRWMEPFRHLFALRRTKGRGRVKYVLLGLCIALPLAGVVTVLLASGDAAFAQLLEQLFDGWEMPEFLATAIRALCAFLLAGVAFYALLCAQTGKPELSEQPEVRRADTLIAVTFTAVLTFVYLVFGYTRLRVLVGGQAVLPAGYTYAEYAREGFFELLAVSGINVLLVIVSQRRFTSGAALRVLLCVISGCTFLMEASSARRMMLYVQVYGLTFLRILVLWFLWVLAVILSGAVVTVFKPQFRLFRFSLAVCLCAWLLLAFARPDNLAAKYDLERLDPEKVVIMLIRGEFSEDAVETLRPHLESYRKTTSWVIKGYFNNHFPSISIQYKRAGFRGFNYSLWRANQTAEAYIHGE